jgi:hypothetical protein
MKKDITPDSQDLTKDRKFISETYASPFLLERNEEGEDVVTFLVEPGKTKTELGIPDSIKLPSGKEVDTKISGGMAVPMGYLDTLSYQGCTEFNADANADKTRPIKGGSSIISNSAVTEDAPNFGTLGLLVVDDDDGTLCALSNAHVTNTDAWIPNLVGVNEKPADQVTASNVVNEIIFQGKESDGYKGFDAESDDAIGILKRYHPMGTMGSVNLSQNEYGNVPKGYGRWVEEETGPGGANPAGPLIMCDASLIALKASVVDNDSWKQIGISSQGSSAAPFVTWGEYVQIMYDSDWGDHGTDVGGGAAGRPKMFSSGRTTGPKEGDPEIEFTAPMKDFPIAYKSAVDSTGYIYSRFTEAFAYSLKLDAKADEILCYNPIRGGDSGSTIWVEINGTWKIFGLAFAGWYDPIAGKTKLGFAMPMPIVAQIMRISAWDGNKSTAKFLDDSNEFTVETVTRKGLGQVESYEVNGKTFYLGGTVLKSKSRASEFEPTYQMDHRDQGFQTNYIYNDWLSIADDSVGYEGRLYFKSNNNNANANNPVTQYTWTSKTGSYIVSSYLIPAEGSPYENMSLNNSSAIQNLLDVSGVYGLSGCDSDGDIANVKPTCLDGSAIHWKSRNVGVSDSSFKTGAGGDTYWSVGGAITIPSEYKSFYISIPSQKQYEPIKISYDDTAADGFDYSTILDLPSYIAALAPMDSKTASNVDGDSAMDSIGLGNEFIATHANLIYPIFKWEDITAQGLESKAARYCYDFTSQDSDWASYIGYQMGFYPPTVDNGKNAGGSPNFFNSSAHHEPTLIPLCMLSSRTDGGFGLTTGYREWGYDDGYGISAEQGGWRANFMYGTQVTGNTTKRGRMKDIVGKINYDLLEDPDNTFGYWDMNKGRMSHYYVLNPRWTLGRGMWRDAHGIPADSELSTPYGHEFEYNSAGAQGAKWDNAKIDKKLNSLSLLKSRTISADSDAYWPRDGFNGEIDLSWVRNFTA